MKSIILNLLFAVGIIFILSCSEEKITAGCNCMSIALEVNAIGKDSTTISLDSIQYIFNNGEIETIVLSSEDNFDNIVGFQAGEYQVWAFYNGLQSETVTVDVEMAGPENCRLPSTKRITFQFEDEYKGSLLEKIGNCSE
jgi:hypothetical protein